MMRRLASAALALACCAGLVAAGSAAGQHTGSLADGATWVGHVPAAFNGTIILYSHGFGPLVAQDAPDAATRADLLAQGYALVGSSYSGPSWWALRSAVDDQFASLAAFERITGRPRRVIAWGTSMGGLISAQEAQSPRGRLAGALTTCGLVAGAVNLNNYQLDGEYAINQLLDPGESIQLVDYTSVDQATTAANRLAAVVAGAQGGAAGRARTALAAALLNAPTWNTGTAPPAPTDYAGQEAQQAGLLSGFLFGFIVPARYQVELADGGGDSAFNVGVDYTALIRHSPYLPEIEALYRQAGLNLGADLATLNRHESVHADPTALRTLVRTSMVTGRLAVPELDIHTTADQLVPVQQENWYARQVARAGSNALFRQAFVHASGHCAFTPADTITALHALEHRLDTRHWDNVTEPADLDAAAAASGL
ncbi:MAG TPA: alpha/beta hydrolase, partial [Pseudonocardiaceae bacterium]|nr:alpha/beta hydrolase [Pseudonocardiaceae bacterium]